MKEKTFYVLAGVGSMLLMAPSAEAGFVGLVVEEIDLPNANLWTFRLYAEFDGNDAADEVIAVFGDADDPMTITSSDGSFFNVDRPFGLGAQDTVGDVSPGLFGSEATLEWDTYVTIGGTNLDDIVSDSSPVPNMDTTSLSPVFAGLIDGDNIIANDNISWFTSDPDANQGLAANNAGNRVMFAQFTSGTDLNGVLVISGEINLTLDSSAGVVDELGLTFWHRDSEPGRTCPAKSGRSGRHATPTSSLRQNVLDDVSPQSFSL